MKLGEVNKLLNAEFGNVLKKSGFKKSNYQFIKSIGDLYIKFLYAVIDSDISFPSYFSYGIGSFTVTHILKKILPDKYDMPATNYPISMGTGQFKLHDEGKYPVLEYDIYTEEDAKRMVSEVCDYMLNVVLPRWETNPTLGYLEQEVNENLIDAPNFTGLILAKLVGNPSYDRIKDHFMKISMEWPGCDRSDLQKVLDFLDSHSREELIALSDNV